MFRSRLEARWAVFFDAMGIRYHYENEGYQVSLPNGEIIRYLPDFYLPDYNMFAEVKGVDCLGQIPKEDAEKMSWMINQGGPCSNGIILLGNIPNPVNAFMMDWAIWKWYKGEITFGYSIGDEPSDDGLWDGMKCGNAPYHFNKDNDLTLTGTLTFDDFDWIHTRKAAVEIALTKARQARFEHGETPII